jgi:hypothetical protein
LEVQFSFKINQVLRFCLGGRLDGDLALENHALKDLLDVRL